MPQEITEVVNGMHFEINMLNFIWVTYTIVKVVMNDQEEKYTLLAGLCGEFACSPM